MIRKKRLRLSLLLISERQFWLLLKESMQDDGLGQKIKAHKGL